MDKIAIIGLGLIGGSIGLALKQQKRADLQIFGFDADVNTGNKAVKRHAVDKSVWKLPEAVDGAKLIVIATPVLSIREALQNLSELVQPGTVVTDTGGTKRMVMEWAEEYLPKGVSFIGGNPLAGKDQTGIDKAGGDLFKNARYCLIPGKSATENAIQLVTDMVEDMGAKPYFIDAFEHDSFAAAMTHLPLLVSEALVAAAAKSPTWREMARLAASGFESTSALCATDPLNNLDQLMTNRDMVVHWTNEAIRELVQFRDRVNGATNEGGAEVLGTALAKNWEAREVWHARYITGETDDGVGEKKAPSFGSPGEIMADFMLGTKLRERYQKAMNPDEKKEAEYRQRRFRRS